MTNSVDIGSKIPEFNLESTLIKKCSHANLLGNWCVLFIYPKDNTSGCTKENEDFNKFFGKFVSLDVQIFGLSRDTIQSHEKFSKKLFLNFPLISDPECTLIKGLSCWVEKSMYGKKYMGVERTTFLINSELQVIFAWRKVKVKNHVEEVLAKINEFR